MASSTEIDSNPFLSFQSLDVVENILDEIYFLGGKKLYYKYLASKVPSHNGDYIISLNRNIINLETFPKDEGEDKYNYINKWNEEETPPPPPIDSWGTLTIPCEIKNLPPVAGANLSRLDDDNRSSRSFTTSKSQTIRSIKSKVVNLFKISGNPNSSPSKQIIEEPKIQKMPEIPKEKEDEQVIILEQKLKFEREAKIKERNEENAKKAKKTEEEDEMKERLKTLNNKLKNKDYTYDYDGSIIFVKPNFRADNLPSEIAILEHNYKGNPEVIKQPYESLGVKIQETKENEDALIPKEDPTKQAQKRSLLKDIKTNSNNNIKPTGAAGSAKFKKKMSSEEDDLVVGVGVEIPKIPPLGEIMEARTGVNITFDNGLLKEGKLFYKEGKMKKEDYKKILDDRKKILEDQRKFKRIEVEEKMEKDDLLQKQMDKVKELKSEHSEMVNRQGISRRVLIHEEAEYVKMMSTGFFGAKPDSKRPSDNNKDAKSVVMPEQHHKYLKMATEIITPYKKIEELVDFKQLNIKPKHNDSQLHQIIEEFNENEILNNPKWGTALYKPNTDKSNLALKKPQSSPQQEKKISTNRERGRLTAGNFLPKVGNIPKSAKK